MKTLKNKKGAAYIYLTVLVLFSCLVISVLLLYMNLIAQVQSHKRDMQIRLDSALAEYSTKIYDTLKQGSEDFDRVSLEENISGHFACAENITEPAITVLEGDGFGITLEYIAFFPVVWNGKTYATLEIPVTLTSFYKRK